VSQRPRVGGHRPPPELRKAADPDKVVVATHRVEGGEHVITADRRLGPDDLLRALAHELLGHAKLHEDLKGERLSDPRMDEWIAEDAERQAEVLSPALIP
jgi:hypothetical protein